MSVQVLGANELIRKFKTCEPKLVKKTLTKLTRAAGKILRKLAKSFVPIRSGDLRDAILLKAAKRKVGRVATNVIISGIAYAPSTEFGNSVQEADDFLKRAAEAGKDEVFNILITGIKAGILANMKG